MKKSKKMRKYILFISLIFATLYAGFIVYVSDYYEAEEIAITAMNTGDIDKNGDYTILKGESDVGIIFYPGAKVEAISYLPQLLKLRNEGFTCILVEMPYNMAIFDTNRADEVFDMLPEIDSWYMAGHSMGGAMASSYASKNQDKIDGLILLGAYVYGDFPIEKSLTIYGTYNSNLEKNIDYTENIVIIEGGNHAQFGNYGKQKGDPDADITAMEQQEIATEAIVEFITAMS